MSVFHAGLTQVASQWIDNMLRVLKNAGLWLVGITSNGRILRRL